MGATFESCGEPKMGFVHHSILEVGSILLVICTCHGGGRYLKLWTPDHSDDNPWYMAHSLIHAFNQSRRREVVVPGTE